jgi:hypothetical protein
MCAVAAAWPAARAASRAAASDALRAAAWAATAAARLPDGGSAARPRTRRLDGSAWPVILRIPGGEQRKDMFRAIRGPAREQAVPEHIEQAAAAESHETGIPTPLVLNHRHQDSFSSA